jgi:lipoprotein-releasing system permease protein
LTGVALAGAFSHYERMIAWRYLRASRKEGGVSVLTWISLIGISLAVFALIVVMAVRSGFRSEFVDTILGANAHVTVYAQNHLDEAGNVTRTISDYDAKAKAMLAVPGVTRVAPLVRAQVLASIREESSGAEVYGISAADLMTLPRIAEPESSEGSIADFEKGIAMGSQLARALGVMVGDRVKLLSPKGARTPMGTTPRSSTYDVVYIFEAGRYDIDRSRIYMPLAEAQSFFNRDGVADEFEVMVEDAEKVEDISPALIAAAGPDTMLWSWKDASGAFLRALTVEDNVMWVVMGVLVLIATLNIISGLIMLVKNKSRDIGILRTMGLTEGAILRVFFMCGAALGITGTIVGVILGSAFATWIDPIFSAVNYLAGGGVWDPEIRGIYALPAELRAWDVLRAVTLSLVLSFVVTIFPARRAARLNPVEALRSE